MSEIKKRKNPFGRNLFTILCIAVLVVAIFLIAALISTSGANVYKPFVDQSTTEEFSEGTYNSDLKRINHESFDDLGIILTCTSFDDNTHVASYDVRFYTNENTPNLVKNNSTYSNVTANICITAKHCEFIQYGTKSTTCRVAEDVMGKDDDGNDIVTKTAKENALASTTYRKTFSVSNLPDFPTKTKGLIFNHKVTKPTIYLYLSYDYTDNASTKTKAFVLQYDFDDIKIEKGGIEK